MIATISKPINTSININWKAPENPKINGGFVEKTKPPQMYHLRGLSRFGGGATRN